MDNFLISQVPGQRGKTIKNGVKLWPIGTDTAKSTIYSRLRKPLPEDGKSSPGYMHFSDELSTEFYEQLTAEKYVRRYIRGKNVYKWENPNRQRNEALDCKVYSYAAALRLGIHRWSEKKWQDKEAQVKYVTGDLLASQPVENHAVGGGGFKGPSPW